jgi:hypothetical protein
MLDRDGNDSTLKILKYESMNDNHKLSYNEKLNFAGESTSCTNREIQNFSQKNDSENINIADE